jgi:hypothetical protein
VIGRNMQRHCDQEVICFLNVVEKQVPARKTILVAALALTGHDAEAWEALNRYLALPSTRQLKTIAAFKACYSA